MATSYHFTPVDHVVGDGVVDMTMRFEKSGFWPWQCGMVFIRYKGRIHPDGSIHWKEVPDSGPVNLGIVNALNRWHKHYTIA